MTVEELLARLRQQLLAEGTPEIAAAMQRFFKEPVDSYGVKSPRIRALAREAYHEIKHWAPAGRNRFSTELFKSGKSEEGALAIYVYDRFSRQCGACEMKLFERWMNRYVTNWAHCDGVCAWLVAASIRNDPRLIPQLHPWTQSANRWMRRGAAVALVRSARRGEHTASILKIAGILLRDPDEMVQKGVGWLLKETYSPKPAQLMRFLKTRTKGTPRLVLRLAAEKMTARDRGVILGI